MTKIIRAVDEVFVTVKGVEDAYRIGLCYDDYVALIVRNADVGQFPARSTRLTPPDQDGDVLLRVEADDIEDYLTEEDTEECEDEKEAAA